MMEKHSTLSSYGSLAFFLFLFFLFPEVSGQEYFLNISRIEVSQVQVMVGEQFTLEGEVKNTGPGNVTISMLTIYGPDKLPERVKPPEPFKDIELKSNETFTAHFELMPRKPGNYSIGLFVMIKEGPVLRSEILRIEAFGEALSEEERRNLLPLGILITAGMLLAVLILGRGEEVFKLAYWREKWWLTLIIFIYLYILEFLPYLPAILPGEIGISIRNVLMIYVESIGGWLVTPIVVALHGYNTRRVIKSFLIASVPFLTYGIFRLMRYYLVGTTLVDFGLMFEVGFMFYIVYLGTSLGLIGAGSALFHSHKQRGIALLGIGWMLLLLQPSRLFFLTA
jgi:hypothetical protein